MSPSDQNKNNFLILFTTKARWGNVSRSYWMLSYSVLCCAFIQSSPDSSQDLTNWSVTHCFGVIYCNWCFYLVPRPSKAIACVCRKTCSPVGCIDWGCWLILLHWHVLMPSHCPTKRLLCKAKITPCALLQMRNSSLLFSFCKYLKIRFSLGQDVSLRHDSLSLSVICPYVIWV